MAAATDHQAKHWTYEEYYNLADDQRYEVINGNLLRPPAPDTWHQDWLGELFLLVKLFVRKNNLGRTFIAPVDVVLDEENVVQPDLVFVAADNLRIIERRAIFGTPDLLVEIISPSSVRRDRYVKQALYTRFGVKEYWIGDAANRSMEILTLTEGRYELHCAAEQRGKLTSLVLPGLEFDLADMQG
jgi:Uma2 family endonuclease